jgi:hypothetical protein
MRAIIDTNVPIVANKGETHASLLCARACVEFIESIKSNGIVVVMDDNWYILREYIHHLDPAGQGVGDKFLRWIFDNQTNPTCCDQIHITPTNSRNEEFAEFPQDIRLDQFDRADRKFVAVSKADPNHPEIYDATDPDWWQYRDVLKANGVNVIFLCPHEVQE